MNSLRFTAVATAAFLLAIVQAAFAETTVPLEGGGATGITLGSSAATGSPRSRADVAAEARAMARQLDSRSGEQSDLDGALHARFTSTRDRIDVRNEGIAFSRQGHPDAYEGGQSGMELARAPLRAFRVPAALAQATRMTD